MRPLVLDALRARRVAVVAVLVGLLAISVGYLAVFPQLEAQLQSFAGELPEFYDALVGDADFSTPAGYVRTQVYALVAPLVATGVAIAAAAGLAKQERAVTLTPLYLAPVSRATLAGAHLLAAWGVGLAAAIGVFVGVVIGAPLAGAEVGIGAIIAATVPFVGFTWAAAAVAWATGAGTGAPGAASGAGWAFVAVSFLANSIGEVVPSVSWLTDVSPWGWYGAGEAITDGFDPMSLLLFALAFVLVPLGVALFKRRDLQL